MIIRPRGADIIGKMSKTNKLQGLWILLKVKVKMNQTREKRVLFKHD